MNQNFERREVELNVQLANEEWTFNFRKCNVDEARYAVEACAPDQNKLQFEITTTPTGKWLFSTEDLPPAIKDNIQQIGNALISNT